MSIDDLQEDWPAISHLLDEALALPAAAREGWLRARTDIAPARREDVLDIHAALDELARIDARLARVVEMRYFAGMSDADIGAATGLTDRTVRRDWEKARLTLAHILRA